MNARLAIELSDLLLSLLVALDQVTRLEVALKVIKGKTAFLALLNFRDIRLQLFHGVEPQVVLQNFLTTDDSIFVLPFDFTLGDFGSSNWYHFGLLGPRVLDLENLGDLSCAHDVNVDSDTLFLLDF